MADNVFPMGTRSSCFSPGHSIPMNNPRGNAIRHRNAFNSLFMQRINRGNGTAMTNASMVTNIGFVPGGYRQVHFGSDLAQSETASIHDIECPTDDGLLPFKPTTGFQTKVSRNQFDANPTPIVNSKPYPPPPNVAYDLAVDAQARYKEKYGEVYQATAVAGCIGKLSEPGMTFNKFAESLLAEGLSRQYQGVSTSIDNRSPLNSMPVEPIGLSGPTSPIFDSASAAMNLYEPSVLESLNTDTSSESGGIERILTPTSEESAAERLARVQLGNDLYPPVGPIDINRNGAPPHFRTEVYSMPTPSGSDRRRLFSRIREWNRNNGNDIGSPVLGADIPSGDARLAGYDHSVDDDSFSEVSLSSDNLMQHQNNYSFARYFSPGETLRPALETEPQSHFSVSDNEESSRDGSNNGQSSSEEVPIMCRVEDMDPAGVFACIQERRELMNASPASLGEDGARTHPFPGVPDDTSSSQFHVSPRGVPDLTELQRGAADEETSKIAEYSHGVVRQDASYLAEYSSGVVHQEASYLAGYPRGVVNQEATNLTEYQRRGVNREVSISTENHQPTIHQQTSTETMFRSAPKPDLLSNISGEQQNAEPSTNQGAQLLFCKICGQHHIPDGPLVSLPERDTCGATLPDWFPRHEFAEPVRAWQAMLNKHVELSQILDGFGHPHPRRPKWENQYHEPSPLWGGLRTNGGWWKCRNDDAAPVAEKECELCHKNKADGEMENLTQEQFLQLVAAEKKEIDDFLAEGTRIQGEKDKELVLKRIREQGSPLTWKD